jgi:hypothetical protein
VKESNEISPGKEGDLASERNPALGISVSPTERHYPGVEEEEGESLLHSFVRLTLLQLQSRFASRCNPAG